MRCAASDRGPFVVQHGGGGARHRGRAAWPRERGRLTLYGVSYGTKVAMVYAALYPDRVERLVLDSVVDPLGPDPSTSTLFAAVPRVMRDVCARRGAATA